MAASLRKIVNATYMPYGSGRDYFFLGDFEYKNGRRTPDMNIRWKEQQKGMTQPKTTKRGQPQEMALTKSLSSQWGASSSSSSKKGKSMSPRIYERLRRQQSEPTCNDALQKGSTGYAHSSRWRDSNSSARDLKARRLRSANPKDITVPPPGLPNATSSELGQVHLLGHDYSFSEFGAPEKFRYHSAHHTKEYHLHGGDQLDEHMREFPGKQKWPPSQAHKFYQNALAEIDYPLDKPLTKTTSLEWGHPAKHHNSSNKKCFPPQLLAVEAPEREEGWRPPEWGMPDKHRYHQPPLWAPKQDGGLSRIPPGKECEIPASGAPPARRATPPGCRVY